MLSRVASSLFWLSRYIERSDGMLRMLKINYASSQDSIQEFTWEPVIRIFAGVTEGENELLLKDSRAVLRYMMLDKDNPNSVLNMITLARENARGVQENITKDLWQCLNEYYHTVRNTNLEFWLEKGDPITALDILIKQGMLYSGTVEITMERGEGRSFMNIGKYLERAIQSVDILETKFGSIDENPDLLTDTTYWKHLLLSLGGYEIYLKTYRQGFESDNIIEQVVLNNDFPRSVLYSVSHIRRYFERLKSDSNISDFKELSFLIGKLESHVRYSTVQGINEAGLHEYLNNIRQQLYSIGISLNQHYFA